MSDSPVNQGVPHGAPMMEGRDHQSPNRSQMRPADEESWGGFSSQQRGSPQPDDERRYADRNPQDHPESFKPPQYRPGPQYEEDQDRYRPAPARSPAWNNRPPRGPQGPPPYPYAHPGQPRSPSNLHPSYRQYGDRRHGPLNQPWPSRGDSSWTDADRARGQMRAPRGRPQGPYRQRGPGPMPPPLNVAGSGPVGRFVGNMTYADYPGPAQPSAQSPPPGRPYPGPNNGNYPNGSRSDQQRGQWSGKDTSSSAPPPLNRHTTDSSRNSESSMGSIPDFPVPGDPHNASQQPSHDLPPRESSKQLQRLPLGPPPSSRRGPSSYYSRSSFVPPIVEEAERPSPSLYSSASFMHEDVPDYYLDDTLSDYGVSTGPEDNQNSPVDHDDSSRLVPEASLEDDTTPAITLTRSESLPKGNVAKGGIVAQAVTSAGAAGGAFAAGLGSSSSDSYETTPKISTLTPITSADVSDLERSTVVPRKEAQDSGRLKEPIRRDALTSMEIMGDPTVLHSTHSPTVRYGSPFAPKSSSPLTPVIPAWKNEVAQPSATPNDLKKAAIVAGLEKASQIDGPESANQLKRPGAGFGSKSGLKRPPRLNVDAVKAAEARGSLTSLQDLIRRATKVASNLDRGKTASRVGDGWFAAEAARKSPRVNNSPEPVPQHRKSGSISEILASFPPPGLTTPTADRPAIRATHWPEYNRPNKSKTKAGAGTPRFESEKQAKQQQRKCCGIPLWAFVLSMIVILSLIVAAIAIPIAVVVIPREKNDKGSSSSALSTCEKNSPCQNGGSSTVTAGGKCSCLCTNGFTGSSCTTASDSACSSMSVADASNATVGNAIPRLLDAAQSNYSIPLHSEKVLAQFSAADISCNTENALVTLDGQSSRRFAHRNARRSINNLYMPLAFAIDPFLVSSRATQASTAPTTTIQAEHISIETIRLANDLYTYMPHPTDVAALVPRKAASDDFLQSKVSSGDAQTVNGILVATGMPTNEPAGQATSSPTGQLVTATGSPTVTASSGDSSATGTPGSSSSATSSEQYMDFARITILFVLQETGSLSDASDAQARLSSWFATNAPVDSSSSSAAKAVDLGSSGWTLDLIDFEVKVKNGTTYGQGPS